MIGSIMDPIQWHEGMLLLPQHFQQSDQRIHQLLHFHMKIMSPFHWGVHHFKIDPVQLVTGTLRFLQLEAVMPDGLIVTRYETDENFLEVDLTPHMEEMSIKPMLIHVAVPAYREGYGNASETSGTPRYSSIQSLDVIDDNTGEGEVQVPKLKPNLKLIIGNEIPTTLVSFPILKVGFESNSFCLKDFVPPSLSLSTKSKISDKCTNVTKTAREKLAFLVSRLRSNTSNLMSRDTEHAVRLLSAGLLPLEAAVQSGGSNPYHVYLFLINLAAQVSGLYPGQVPPQFDPYNHNDLQHSFEQVAEFIFTMIDRIQEGYTVVPFRLTDRTFQIDFPEGWIADKIVLGAQAPSTMSESELVNWVENCVIVSQSLEEASRDKRVRGIPRTVVQSSEDLKLLPAKGMVLFEMDGKSEYLKPDELLRVFNVNDTLAKRPTELVLYLSKKIDQKFF